MTGFTRERVRPSYPLPLLLHCEEALQTFGYDYDLDMDADSLKFSVVTTFGKFDAEFIISEIEQVARLFILLGLGEATAVQAAKVRELGVRLDEILALGSYVVIFDTGAVYYRHGIDFRGHPEPTELFDQALNCSAFALQLWDKAEGFARSGASAVAAVEAAAHIVGGTKLPESAEGRRLLLKLEN